MSRWIEQYETHAFQGTWSNLKNNLEESTVDDETALSAVKELARLKKVISFLDELLNCLDPELVPMNTWDSFNSKASYCSHEITNYNANKNIASISQANEHADSLLAYIRPYMVVPGEAGRALQASVAKYAMTIDSYSNSFSDKSNRLLHEINDYKIKSETVFSLITATKKAIDGFKNELFGTNDKPGGTVEIINNLVKDFGRQYREINDYYKETLISDENTISTKQSITEAAAVIAGEKQKIYSILDDITTSVSDLEEFHTQVFGDQSDKNNTNLALTDELDTLIKKLKKFETEQHDKYIALNAEIEELLEGATNVGLASAYCEMKTSFNKPIKNFGKLFYLSVGLLVAISTVLSMDTIGGDSLISFVTLSDWNDVLRGLVYKAPFYIPILWLAFYATKRRSEYQRLQQEYAHKEALARSYNSYKKQIEELGDTDKAMQKRFIMRMIDVISRNSSQTLESKRSNNPKRSVGIKNTTKAPAKLNKAL